VNIRARGNDTGVGQIKRVFHDGAVKAARAYERDSVRRMRIGIAKRGKDRKKDYGSHWRLINCLVGNFLFLIIKG